MSAMQKVRMQRAFTLVELLVVVAIIALLVAIMLPSLGKARAQARGATCLSNLHQLLVAAQTYTADFGSYPIARDGTNNWDVTTALDPGGTPVKAAGILYRLPGAGAVDLRIFMCPDYVLASNPTALFTGYNYNTSYVGHGVGEAHVAPARAGQLTHPATTALFGDGQGTSGPNRFMRAPVMPAVLPPPDWGDSVDENTRAAGTQGYRHHGTTNVAWADGHAESWSQRAESTSPHGVSTAKGTGFLSANNLMYGIQ